MDLAFLDGTFASPAEIPNRSVTDIPHPMIPATRDLLRGTRAQVWFIHLNHTNPALQQDSAALRTIRAAGFDIARENDCIFLENS